ncbi:MAG: threonine ammonia-lyase [Xanthomonadaceae bacterium]|nr:threonine ammonia-lyase [Xanthomonadaceae bacterium]
MKKTWDVSLTDIQAAKQELSHFIQHTPLLYNSWLSEEYGCEIYLKLENMQPIGSFKIRGATYKIASLTKEEKKRGVIAASAGNHAQGVAWGAQKLGVKATIVMPETAALTKVQNTKALGAEVVLHGKNYDEAYAETVRLAKKSKKVMIHAFEDPLVVAGQGTVGIEIMEQLPDADWIVGSIGGGGLLAGLGIAVKALSLRTKILGCQAKGASAMVQSMKSGKIVVSEKTQTFADGIAVKRASPQMRKLLKRVITKTALQDDEAIAGAVLTLLEKAKVIAEGAAAISLACLGQIRNEIKGKKVVLLICGGNIDVNILSRIIDRGLIKTGRRIRLNVWIPDIPGSLSKLTEWVGQAGANILQAIHDRDLPSTRMNETEVDLTLETRGIDHAKQVIASLKAHGVTVKEL